MSWLRGLRDYLREELARHPRLVLVGDFNIAPEDRDSYDPEGLRETIHHTTEERDHFRKLLELGLCDSFRLFEQPEKSFSWWDYRMLGYQKNRGPAHRPHPGERGAQARGEGLRHRPHAAQVEAAERPCAGDGRDMRRSLRA